MRAPDVPNTVRTHEGRAIVEAIAKIQEHRPEPR